MIEFLNRHAFKLFHYTLGVIIFCQSVVMFIGVAESSPTDHDSILIMILAIAEAAAAVGFLFPKLVKKSGYLLLCIIAIAILVHVARGQVESTLLVYAAGIWLVIAKSDNRSK